MFKQQQFGQYVKPTQPKIFKQVKNQSKRYSYTIYNLQVLELQSVRYTYTAFNFQANNKSIKTLHLHNL